ncbi:hypothetical protein PV325_003534 [Microctonus aethiopoides]|nr:hypothetical protein PV325_003534 [Microctonus aethiopoides]
MTNSRGSVVARNNFESSERWRILKNILIIGIAFMIHFTAFMGASNLQSSINADDSLGTSTLASIYGSLIFSNIFLPVLIISWLGCKWTIALSFIAYIPFIAAQFFPKFYTMIPAGLAVGLGGGPLWCAKCTYLTVVAEAYSTVSQLNADVLVTRFFGLFFMFYQLAQVWGNLISSAVLSYGMEELPTSNVTLNSSVVAEICGANFCYKVEENPNLASPPVERIHLISGIYLGCMVMACLIVALGVDSLSRYDRGRSGSAAGKSGFQLLIVTLKLLKEKRQLFILPITIFIGAEQAFLFADYNASFVSCAWGITLSGILFPGMEEAAYSNFRLWEATGSVVAYGYSPYLCTSTKLYVLIIILITGVVGYGIIEFTGGISKVTLVDPKTDFELVHSGEETNDK